MKTNLLPVAALLALLPLAACSDDCDCPKPATPAATAAAQPKHVLNGVVVDVLPAQQSLLIKHEAIADFMPAMTMAFKVDATTLAAAKKDAPITGELVMRDGAMWLDQAKFKPTP